MWVAPRVKVYSIICGQRSPWSDCASAQSDQGFPCPLTEPFEPQRHKRIFGHVRPPKIQIRLRECAVWSESSVGAFRIPKDAQFPHVDNKDWSECVKSSMGAHVKGTFSHVAAHLILKIILTNTKLPDQIGRMCRMIFVFMFTCSHVPRRSLPPGAA